ncbi:Plectin, partial [Taenia solium]|eukprot:TsM_001234000 transcript=TsM_001234000 gene=TsM_001234000
MAIHRGDIGVIKKALADYELKAQEMNVGVNYMALDDERRRQEHLLRELQELEVEIKALSLNNPELPHLASIVGAELSHNTKCLQYLTGISELERSIGEVAAHFTERSVKLSDPASLHKSVVTYKTLTDNVKSCWMYVDQLAALAQIHLKASAEYHQFYHEANEVEAKLEKQLMIAQKAHQSATMRRSHKEATKVANEIREQLNMMQSLWQRSKNLVKRSETIVPIRLRLGGVAKGAAIGDPNSRPVMMRAMVSLTGPDYKIQKGEQLQLIDNRQDSHLWRVQTTSGIVEVPSVCFWLTDTDAEATERAISIKQLCKKTWLEIVNLISLRLYELYVDLLQQFNSQEVICSHEGALNMLLSDLQRQLIAKFEQDGRLQSEVATFRKGVIITKRLERLQSGDINLREPDIVQIRAPLLRLQDHLMAVEQMRQEMVLLNDHIADYLSEVNNERWQISHTLDHLNRLTKQNEQELNDMMREMEQLKTAQERRLYQQTPGHLKVQPLRLSEQKGQHKRSRSQPRMSVVNAISSSTGSSDSEPTSDPYIRGGGRRAKSQVMQLDAMVQIGTESKSAETQHQDGRIEVNRRYSQQHKSVQLIPMQPVKINAQTLISCMVSDSGVQVDSSSLESYNMVIKRTTSLQRSRSLTPSSEDDESHEYITEVAADVPLQAAKTKGRRRYTAAAQSGPLSKKKSSSLTSLVHSCTQLGTMTTDKAVSPVKELDSTQSCPNCRSKIIPSSQTQVGQIYSGSEKYHYHPTWEVNSEDSPRQHRVSKKVQSGYPCLTDRANLYCQCDVLGPIMSHEGTEVGSNLHQSKMNTYTQIGVLYSNARQQAEISDYDVASASTQVGRVDKDLHQRSPISHERRRGQAQTRPRSVQEISSFSGAIETLSPEANERTTMILMRPQAANSSTQIGTLLSGKSVQTNKYDDAGVTSKRTQIGYSQVGKRSHSYTQVGQLYHQTGVQKGHIEINVEPDMVPIAQISSSMEHSAPPSKGRRNGMSVQVTRKMYDDATHIAHVLSHNEVQTQNLPNFNVRQHNLQVYDIHRHKPRRSSSMPSIQFSTETQIGPMVMHENLSPIDIDAYGATPKAMRNKRIQSVSIPSTRNVEMQIGQLLQQSGTQSLVGLENFDETPIAPTLLSVQQKAISMPNVGVTGTQVQPSVRGKKLQVSIAMDAPVYEKKYNKKLQVSVIPSREMYDVQVETVPILMKEQFDVGCDTKIQPENISKKIQVSLVESGPEVPMIDNQNLLYAAMPPQSPVEAIPLVQPETTVQVRSAPPPQLIDASCEAITNAKYFDAKCQCDDLKPMTMGKKLQVELGGQMTTPDKVDIACDSSDLVKTVGKKLQVELNEPSQVTSKAMKDEMCAAMDERKMYDANQQTAIIDEQPPIFNQATLQPVYSAPPMSLNANMSDTACEALRIESACDGFTQSEKIRGVGKKLQVSITIEEPEKLAYEIASMQACSKDTFIPLSEPSRVQPVYAAPPAKPAVDTEDRGCDALPRNDFFDASVQSVEFTQPKPSVLGKKLQVSLPNLTTSIIQMEQPSVVKPLGLPKAVQTDEFYPQPPPQLVTLQEATKVYSAPPPSQPRATTEDRACDAIAGASTFNAAIQTSEAPKPEAFGKKLQVNLMPLVVMSSQSTVEVQPPSQPIYVENVAKVFSAPPPQAQPKVQTEDRACDAIMKTPVFDAGVQIAEQGKSRAVVVGKKLQVTPSSLALATAQTIFEQPPPQVIHLEEGPKVCSAPPMPSQPKVQMDDKSCDAIEPAKVFDAGVQAAELQPPKAVIVGKKLQVTPPALTIISSQGTGVIAAPEKPFVPLEVSGVQTVQELAIAPPTEVVHVEQTNK